MENFTYRNFTELDFEQIKESLKTFLKQQDDLKDYNFEGSAINAILNVLAYTTQYNAFYQNMNASEAFLATAQRRENVVGRARSLGYVPRSSRGAVALLDLRLTPESNFTGNTIQIPKDTVFNSKVDGQTVTFFTRNAVTVVRNEDGEFIADNVEVFQGKRFTFNYEFKEGDTGFTIPNTGVDTDTIVVVVKDSASDPGVEFAFAGRTQSDITQFTPTSRVYFLEETIGEKFRIFFGDNIVSLRPSVGQIVQVVYFTNKGRESNGAVSYTLASSIPFIASASVINSPVSGGGDDIETTESIRVNAPLFFDRQNRAVTANDYRQAVLDVFPEAFSVAAWGGEDNVPPALGYVFLSIVKTGFDEDQILTDEEKEFIEESLRNRFSVITIFPQVLNPKFTFVELTSRVNFDSRVINPGAVTLRTNAIDSVFEYGLGNFSKFEATVRFSKLVAAIDLVDPSVVSNDTDIRLYAEQRFLDEFEGSGFIEIGVPISDRSVISSRFTYQGIENCFLRDNPSTEQLDLYKLENNLVETLVTAGVAEFDYVVGRATFLPLVWDFQLLDFSASGHFRLFGAPLNRDITFQFNRIPVLRKEDIKLTVNDILAVTSQ